MTTKHETALRVAIAEKLGFHRCGKKMYGRSGNQREIIKGIHPRTSLEQTLPDYPASLDAMHEAVLCLSGRHEAPPTLEYSKYYHYLIDLTYPLLAIDATALQRAEAFVRACGLEARVKELEETL